MLLKEIKKVFHIELDALYSRDEVDSFFYILIEHYLHLERFILALNPQQMVTKEEEQPLYEALSKLKSEIPIQYITGETSFMDLTFEVDQNVLIPRPETEELVKWIISLYGRKQRPDHAALRILDIGTGSGCIAVALAKNIANSEVHALDLSAKILNIAAANARRNEVHIALVEANIFEVDKLDEKFDIIVSNPPYVRELEKKQMHKNVLDFEPETALFVKDDAPLIYYEKIAQMATVNLTNGGMLFLEINQYLGEETAAVLRQYGFVEIEMRKDLFENNRMLKGSWKPGDKDVE
ncbi:peptide chain release factor N(5)-glutamine methyltransferase [Muriicola sp. Z0-33]|uniref:peptide chain release factor N(5)-glutamine methyltransferase n=1 Tax=Muriicola sp. Z0-33 TaxID=2816957 RepID=UPI00223807E9|nr:peptide chain release factor N(5)-glutamine methyltransferase [Muriicola sp. Z0-33]MCW5516526.1 peptide chain release factor N(5)-glutamine methyltransferase [Muriicola sp. Z0-33]